MIMQRSPLTVLKRRVAPTWGLRPRGALEAIGNRAPEPKIRAEPQRAMAEGIRGAEPSTKPRHLLGERGQEQGASEPQPLSAVETPGCAMRDVKLVRAFSDVLLDVGYVDKEDVDTEDNTNLDLCIDYEKDIYKYLGELEKNQTIRPKYLAGWEIDVNMHALLVDWLLQIQIKCMLLQETLYMTVAIIDRFLQDNDVAKKTFKYEEVYPMSIGDFLFHHMERKILKALDFCLGCPLPPHFLRRIAKIAKVIEYSLAKYLMELCIMDYDMVYFPSSKIAAAAACLTLKLLKGCKWTPTLQHCTSYTDSNLLPVMQHICKFVNRVHLIKFLSLQAIKNKYAMSTNYKISTAEELNSSIIWDLALPVIKY
uniref:Cyclin B1 n=1 Tax=Athene cunicularia TaxID=194338 RepID=A0A663N1U9_ATHCN